MSIKNILLATRPLVPPWDEASKNFAYFLAKSIQDPELGLHLLTVQGKERLEHLGDNCVEHPIYPANDENHAGFPLAQKVRIPLYLARNSRRYDIVHYLFTPTKFNAFLIRLGLRLSATLNFLGVIPGLTRDPDSHFPEKNHGSRLACLSGRQGGRDDKLKLPKTIQTIATLREDLYGPDDWKQMFFADQLVVYSDYSKTKLEAAGFKNVQRIYPGIDLEKYSPQPKSPEAMRHFNLTPEDFVVLYPGEYVRLGATDMLVEMLAEHLTERIGHCEQSEAIPNKKEELPAIIHNHDNIPGDCRASLAMTDSQKASQNNIIFIFGNRIKNEADKKKKAEVVARLTAAGVIDQVRFTDTWKDMPTLYNLADVVVFPAGDMKGKFDIPLAIIEPYACAKPVILSDLPLFAEFSNPAISVTIAKGDGEALWQAIEDLQADEAKRKSLGTQARGFVEGYFDLRDTARKYEALYSSLIVNPGVKPAGLGFPSDR